jgi:hypothetical protein
MVAAVAGRVNENIGKMRTEPCQVGSRGEAVLFAASLPQLPDHFMYMGNGIQQVRDEATCYGGITTTSLKQIRATKVKESRKNRENKL